MTHILVRFPNPLASGRTFMAVGEPDYTHTYMADPGAAHGPGPGEHKNFRGL